MQSSKCGCFCCAKAQIVLTLTEYRLGDTSNNCCGQRLVTFAQPIRHLDIVHVLRDADGRSSRTTLFYLWMVFSTEDDGGDDTLYERVPDTQDPFEAIDATLDAELLLDEAQTLIPDQSRQRSHGCMSMMLVLEESADALFGVYIRFHTSSRGIQRLRDTSMTRCLWLYRVEPRTRTVYPHPNLFPSN